MRALVTGGGGFLGLYITEMLVQRGIEVRVFCRNRYRSLDELGVETMLGDLRESDAVGKACDGIDVVFHVAALPGIWGPWKLFHGINTQGTLNVIDACRSRGVGRLIYTSSPSVVHDGKSHENIDETQPYPDRYLSHYSHSKALAEQAVLAANNDRLATVALRPHLIWGPRDNHLIPRLIRRAQSGRLRQVGDGRNRISMTYVENAAAAHLQAADALSVDSPVAGQTYFVNESEPVNLWEWINEILTRAGLSPLRKSISAKSAYRVGAVLEGIYRLLCLPGEPAMTRFLASELSSSHCYNISKAQRDFGYQPPVTVEEGMRRMEPELKRLAENAK